VLEEQGRQNIQHRDHNPQDLGVQTVTLHELDNHRDVDASEVHPDFFDSLGYVDVVVPRKRVILKEVLMPYEKISNQVLQRIPDLNQRYTFMKLNKHLPNI
jgi:hypothetical protein